jgi:hypothetical protein
LTLQQAITELAALHRQLATALDAGDTVLVQELVQARQPQLEALASAWQAASDEQRQRHSPALQALHTEQLALLQRCLRVRDELQTQLAGGPRRPNQADRQAINGSLDLQA